MGSGNDETVLTTMGGAIILDVAAADAAVDTMVSLDVAVVLLVFSSMGTGSVAVVLLVFSSMGTGSKGGGTNGVVVVEVAVVGARP